MGKFCTNCGNMLEDNANMCMNCGKVINNLTTNNDTSDCEKNANTGFVFGLISIAAWFIPLIGYPITICGIVMSSKGLKANENKTKAVVGLILSIIFLVLTLINSLLGALMNLANL